MNIVVSDLLNPKGHKTINEFYLKIISESSLKYIFYSSETSYVSNDYEKRISYNDDFLGGNRLKSLLFQCFIILKLCLFAKKFKANKIILLSYDIGTLPFISLISFLVIKNINIITFEHNTAPKNKKSIVSFLHYISGSNIIKLCYSESLRDLYKSIKCKAIYIPHPILSKKKKGYCDIENIEKTVFCPSASSNVNKILNSPKLFSSKVIFKTSCKIRSKDLLCISFFDNYYTTLSSCKLVYLPVDLENRVSGPFFEALYYNKVIVVENNSFGKLAKKIAPKNVIYSSLFTNKLYEEYVSILSNCKYDVVNYNENIKSLLKGVLLD